MRQLRMCRVQIALQCVDRFFETLLDDLEDTKLTIEELTQHVLSDSFGAATVDEVSIHLSPHASEGQQLCTIQISARCPVRSFLLLPQKLKKMELVVEGRVSCAFLELFDRVEVDDVSINLLPPESDKAALPRGA